MLYTKVVLIIFLTCSSVFAETENQIKKFEDLFIWKISDELKLTPKEESVVTTIIKESNKKKSTTNAELESLYKKLNEAATEDVRKTTFTKIRSVHKAQLAVTLEELDRLNKGIGLKKLGRYLALKRDLAEKIKGIWIQHEKKGSPDLPPPKVIEEK